MELYQYMWISGADVGLFVLEDKVSLCFLS